MKGKYLQDKVTAGKFTLPVAVFITIACWVVTFILIPELPRATNGSFLKELIDSLNIPEWTNRLISLILCFMTGYFLIEFNNTFALIRIRASVQTSIYLLFITACPVIHLLYPGDIACVTFVISVFFLFKSYQHPNPTGYVFHSFVSLGLGSLIFPQLTLFAPAFLLGVFFFQSLTIRSFFASLIGWSIPYWFLFGYAFFHDKMDVFYQPFRELVTFQPIDPGLLQFEELVTLGYFFVLYIVCSIHCFADSYKDKIRTRVFLRFLIFLSFLTFVFIVLQPGQATNLLPLLFIGISVLTGHFLVMTNGRASNLFFICATIGLILLFTFNVWTLL